MKRCGGSRTRWASINALCAASHLRAAGYTHVDWTRRSRVVLVDADRLRPQRDFRWVTWHIRPSCSHCSRIAALSRSRVAGSTVARCGVTSAHEPKRNLPLFSPNQARMFHVKRRGVCRRWRMRSTVSATGCVVSISAVAVARSRGSTDAVYSRISCRSASVLPYGFP